MQLQRGQNWAENRDGAKLGLTFLAVLGQAVREGGREERNIVLVLKEEATGRPHGAIYKHRREMGGREPVGTTGLSKGLSEGLKQPQPQVRPGSSGNHSTPSRVRPDLRPSLEKLKYVPEMALSFTV